MFLTYLRRELFNRRRQTVIVSVGLAIGIALVSVVSAITTGVKDSQSQVLQSLYGIGTDITVTQQAAPGQDRPRFEIGTGDGQSEGGVQTFSRTRLRTERGAITFVDDVVSKIAGADGVEAIATALKLTNTTFEGELPTFMERQRVGEGEVPVNVQPESGSSRSTPSSIQPTAESPTSTATDVTTTTISPTTTVQQPTGGADGRGGSAFTVTEFSVLGIESHEVTVGPMNGVSIVTGRLLSSTDVGKKNAVLDSSYAATEELAVKDKISIAGKSFVIVGIVGPTAGAAQTSANVYIPIDVARTLASVESGVTNVYVKAADGNSVTSVKTTLNALLPDATISTSAELAETVSGSLSTASDLMSNFGNWLSVIVLIVAFVLAVLFTMGGVSRRTREFGTLKALGWRSGRIIRQIMAESVVQGIGGGIFGAIIAFGGVAIVNIVAPTLEASAGGSAFSGPNRGGPVGGGPFGGLGTSQTTFEVVLNASITPSILATAITLAVVGGILAGAAGGLRAARLRPAESLRSVA